MSAECLLLKVCCGGRTRRSTCLGPVVAIGDGGLRIEVSQMALVRLVCVSFIWMPFLFICVIV